MNKVFLLSICCCALFTLNACSKGNTEPSQSTANISKEDRAVFELIIAEARKGDADAQLQTGYMYDYGNGVEQDVYEAFNWYIKAAHQGKAEAQFLVGAIYFKGLYGFEKNYKDALIWFSKAAAQGFEPAAGYLEFFDELSQLILDANNGDAQAQYELASRFSSGRGVEKQDYLQALKWYEKAAAQNNGSAAFNIGLIYYNGNGVKKDYKKAFQYFNLAKKLDIALADHMLAAMYYYGQGTEKDYSKSLEYYKAYSKVAGGIDQPTIYTKIADMYYNGEGTAKNLTEALHYYSLSAKEGDLYSKAMVEKINSEL
ncbi:hypothetical protein Dip510_002078 [Elusimicrobium posterum]|uniref:SEL1-like repeat protein n=1 Tax=Elusimicrobium posterum TaxID=3116653 RepID=UPI003C7220A9